ncbi:sensor histidine kinase [Alcanivorax sp. S6407]|uniref:sensor histidine kinase n=1 Tax=Alcanivorax sp. S6407 TaxID=2926424 RepID=UPI001FF6378C|nr:sensor histidine kinase [Alcanivorax sp. S6407]MCK0153632.1 sensor histidine kinase [Alcanivorax sp. S6407]
MQKFHLVLFVLLALLSSAAQAIKPEPVALKGIGEEVTLGDKMQILEDPESDWSLDQVRNQFASRFRSSEASALNFGFTDSTIWLRFAVDASNAEGSWFMVERHPILDELTLYVPDSAGGYKSFPVGDTRPFSLRPMNHRSFVFSLDTDDGGVTEYYLKIKGKGALNMMPMLYSAKGLVEYSYVEQLIQGLFYGSLAIMLIYNLMLFLSLRDNVHLHFVMFLAGIIFFNITVSGYGLQFLWPETPKINEYFWLATYVIALALALYSRQFLQLAQRFPRYDRLLRHYLILIGVAFLLQWVLQPPFSYHLSTFIALLTIVLFSWLGWTVWRQGFRVARLYVLAWSIFLLTIFFYAIGNLGLIPYHPLVPYLPHIGALWVVVMLSLALGDRIRFLENERKQLALEAQQNLERHLSDIEQMNQDKSMFLQYISHELNTPINWIGAADSLGSNSNEDSDVDVWAMVRKGQKRLIGIVGTSLRYFDLSDRNQAPLVGSCQPMWMMDALIREDSDRIEQAGISIRNRVSPNLRVRASETELREVFAIALDNALRFSAEGGHVEVSSEVSVNDGFAHLVIRDEGKGATADQLEHIMEPFFVMGSRHHEEGFGLSLAMARVMVEQVGGQLWAESPGPGRGFSLHLRLPLADFDGASAE